jgi:glutaredoxin
VEQMVFYTASWSEHCRKAEDVLETAGVTFDRWDLSDPSKLGAASRDLDIRKLPALRNGVVHCEGLAQIVEFVTGNHH